jgi:hypothetical protein
MDDLTVKLPDPDLRSLATEGSDSVVSVLIQVDEPPPRVTLAQGTQRRWRVDSPSAAGLRRAEAAQFLGQVLGSTPRWLSAAGAFVADVTGAQLAEIARSPLTRSVARNRNLPAV